MVGNESVLDIKGAEYLGKILENFYEFLIVFLADRFWKMARTFTGLKLQGQLGKFGKKEISDIEGYVELPDGKVLSGSEWGNMLLWDGGLIKVEISRKNKKPCHQGSIQQIIMDEGELMTIGNDGYIRVSQHFSCYLAMILVLAFYDGCLR